MTKYWEHRNLDVFKYGIEGAAGPSDKDRQSVDDWSRHVISGEMCTYCINGKKVSDIRKEDIESNGHEFKDAAELKNAMKFKDEDDLCDFFKKHLFANVEEVEQDKLARSACQHFHQAGLTHATNFCVKNSGNVDAVIKVGDPKTMVNFQVAENGLTITEENTYKKWFEILDPAKKPREHLCTGSKDYYAKTTSTYLFTSDDIKLVDLKIDCPSRNLAKIFDKRPESEQITRYLSSGFLRNLVAALLVRMMGNRMSGDNSVEPKTIYRS